MIMTAINDERFGVTSLVYQQRNRFVEEESFTIACNLILKN